MLPDKKYMGYATERRRQEEKRAELEPTFTTVKYLFLSVKVPYRKIKLWRLSRTNKIVPSVRGLVYFTIDRQRVRCSLLSPSFPFFTAEISTGKKCLFPPLRPLSVYTRS